MKHLVINRPVYLDSHITLTKPTESELEKLKEHLTFDNPSYVQAKKYSRYSRISISPYLTYYKVRKDKSLITIPLGTDIDSFYDMSHVKIIDRRSWGDPVNVPKFLMTLREDQQKAQDAFIQKNKRPLQRNGLIQLPTAKGKSVLGLSIAYTLGVKTLIVVHKDDLVIGWKNDIEKAFGGKTNVGIIKAKKREIGHFLTIATVQTLNRMSEEEIDELYGTFGLVIQDEAHHCPASTFSIVENFTSRYKLAITATPERSDGLTHVLNLYFGGFAYQYEQSGDEKDILPVEVKKIESGLYFNPMFNVIHSNKGDIYQLIDLYAPREKKPVGGHIRLSDIPYKERPQLQFQELDNWIVTNPYFVNKVITDILEETYKHHSSVAFFSQKEHCNYYYNILKEVLGDKVQIYNGDTKDNAEALRKADSREVLVTLTTYAKGTEGTNVNAWEVEFLVSSMNNEKNTEQAAGRIRRLKEGKMKTALIYDYRHPEVYSVSSHAQTRDHRYRQLGFSFYGQSKKSSEPTKSRGKSVFNRGY